MQIFTANTHTPVLFFSTQGLVYKIKAHKIPEGTAASKGKSIFNILPLKSHHSISSIMPLPEDESEWKNMMVVFATSKGNVRKNTLEDFTNINNSGKIAMKLDGNDKIIGVNLKGPTRVTALAATQMAKTGGGSIINISSVASNKPSALTTVYSAAKAG